MMYTIRPARVEDIPFIDRIQKQCYSDNLLEAGDVFAAKIRQSPDLCLVADMQQEVVAYMMCIRASLHSFPRLHTDLPSGSEPFDFLYLHDMAISPKARGVGIRTEFLARIFARARQDKTLDKAFLVAVQGAEVLWKKEGFVVADPAVLGVQNALQSYGEQAVLMCRDIHP